MLTPFKTSKFLTNEKTRSEKYFTKIEVLNIFLFLFSTIHKVCGLPKFHRLNISVEAFDI